MYKWSELIEEVVEPDYSKAQLIMFENKYNITTDEFINNVYHVNNVKDRMKWKHNYLIYSLTCGKE